MNNELKWSITSLEKRTRLYQAISFLAPIILGLIFSLVYELELSFKVFLYFILFLVIQSIIFLLINRLLPQKETNYLLTDDKLTILAGNKIKEYPWNEFEYFYSSRKWTNSEFYPKKREVMGDSYYLRKKSKNFISKLYKNFLVIYSKPENDKDVNDFLSNHLPARASIKDELGLISYEFKDRQLKIAFLVSGIFWIIVLIIFLLITASKPKKVDPKIQDLRVVLAMNKIDMEAVSLSFKEDYGYTLLACDYNSAMTSFCSDIEKETGVKPTIHSNKEEFCFYVKLNLPYGEKDDYYCIDRHLNSGYTTNPAPEEGGGCDGKTFNCANVRQ